MDTLKKDFQDRASVGSLEANHLKHVCEQAKHIVDSVQDLTPMLADSEGRQVVAVSQAMNDIGQQATRYAQSTASVMLTGESGTGKEVIARMIHDASPRGSEPYIRVNCAALSNGLFESELFGHEQGAFTGAVERRAGRFELADGGTLLLDEISEIPVNLQAKLLRVLEEDEYQRVGGSKTYRVNVRVIATSNRSLEREIAEGNFRADLYYRLNTLQIHMPPLRHRRDDIAALTSHFIECFRDEASVPIRGVKDETLDILRRCDWPGNVRQLRNVIHRACVINTTGVLQPTDLPILKPTGTNVPDSFSDMRLDEIERHVIVSNLRRFEGNKTATARHLGVTARTLLNKVKRYRQLGYM